MVIPGNSIFIAKICIDVCKVCFGSHVNRIIIITNVFFCFRIVDIMIAWYHIYFRALLFKLGKKTCHCLVTNLFAVFGDVAGNQQNIRVFHF